MQVRVDWVLKIFGTQVIKKKRPVQPMFPDYLSVSYDYGISYLSIPGTAAHDRCNISPFFVFYFQL